MTINGKETGLAPNRLEGEPLGVIRVFSPIPRGMGVSEAQRSLHATSTACTLFQDMVQVYYRDALLKGADCVSLTVHMQIDPDGLEEINRLFPTSPPPPDQGTSSA